MKRKNILYVVPSKRNLKGRSASELRALCYLMVLPHSGTKSKITERILAAWYVRTAIKNFSNRKELVEAFKSVELKNMCKAVKVYAGSTKLAKAAALLNWRNECRSKGLKRLEEARAIKRQMKEAENAA
ncbi:MAG: hypothetical protein M0Z52_03895 [Actinomycetota bacterium]|nr:hypothetical protein [Actinomycetota bacterium]